MTLYEALVARKGDRVRSANGSFASNGSHVGANGDSHAGPNSANGRSGSPTSTRAVVLAGGRGTRLAPYTNVLPKPLMPIGDRAILEVVVDQLEGHGITDITFCVGYLSHLIRSVFDNRANGHVKIGYVHEQEALGTAGPLRLIDGLDESFIVMNGDVLTTIDYADLLRHHREAGNALTIATRERAIKIDYGVLHIENGDSPDRIVRFVEKPELQSTVSMGIYVFEPSVLDYVPEDRHFDFPELVQALLADDEQVGAYPFDGVWFDIGREDDYARAAEEWDRRGSVNGANGNGNGNGNGHVPAPAADRSAAGSMS